MHSGWYTRILYCTNNFVHAENVFRRVHCRTLDNAATYPLRRLQARPRSSCLTQNSVGLLRTRFPSTMLSLSWIDLPNISIPGLLKPTFRKHRSNIGSHIYVACLIATFILFPIYPLRPIESASCRPPSLLLPFSILSIIPLLNCV